MAEAGQGASSFSSGMRSKAFGRIEAWPAPTPRAELVRLAREAVRARGEEQKGEKQGAEQEEKDDGDEEEEEDYVSMYGD